MNLPATRRHRFLELMGEGVALIPSASEVLRSGTSHYRFRPDSDFYYLTGFAEPDAALLLTPHHPEHRVVLFVRPKDPSREVWTGRRAGLEGARERYGADVAYPIEQLSARLSEYLLGAHRLYYRLGPRPALDQTVIAVLHELSKAKRRLTPSPTHIIDASVILHEMRLFKSAGELEHMRHAAAISAEAHRLAMAATRPGRTESDIEALVEYTFRNRGAVGPGYPTIVGGGINATILHYIDNSDPLRDGDLLLLDAGAEYQYYTADITRTWPINGRFSPLQRDVYEIVLEAQRAAIDRVRPGVGFNEAHYTALRVLTEGLVSLGVLEGSIDSLLEQEAYLPYYMHRTSHWLGLDVHDAGDYVRDGRFRPLEPGMVLTVEPGLYFGADIPERAARFRGIGVRIEDDVLVTADGPEILTREAPKTIEAIEALVGRSAESP